MRTAEVLVIKFGDVSPEAFYSVMCWAYGVEGEPESGYSWFVSREGLLKGCQESINNENGCYDDEWRSHCKELLPLLEAGNQKYVLFDNEDDVPDNKEKQ